MSLKRATTKDRPLKVRDASDTDEARSFLFYGRSGTGKTTLAATFPGPALLIDVKDRGTDSVSNVKGLKIFDCGSFAQFEEVYWFLVKHPKVYSTVIVDTVSQLQSMAVEEISSGKKGKKAGDWGSMSRKEWGEVAAVMKEWLINFRDLTDLGVNVVFIAQDRTFNVDEEEAGDSQLAPEVGPGLSPSVAKALNASVSVVGNTFIRSKISIKEVRGRKIKNEIPQYCLRIGPNPVYVTKIRKPKSELAPAYIVNPTYEDILSIIEGK